MSISPIAQNAMHVLVVDDEKNMRATLASILNREGYSVTTAASGEEAVELCVAQDYDVVLMDVRMPGIDGVEAFRRIHQRNPGVRVIMMSAYSIEEMKDAALEEGVAAFLPKPLNVEHVVKLVAEVKDTMILVVEDDPETIDILQTELTKRGYNVTSTTSPIEALQLAEQIRFDVIFIDAKLPAMNGLDFYLAIKKINPTALAIMITGIEPDAERVSREALRQTAYAVVQKPPNMDHILSLLSRIAGQRASNAIKKPDHPSD